MGFRQNKPKDTLESRPDLQQEQKKREHFENALKLICYQNY